MGCVSVHADSFRDSVASPFHSFVTTASAWSVQPPPQSTKLSWQPEQRTTSQTHAQPRKPLPQARAAAALTPYRPGAGIRPCPSCRPGPVARLRRRLAAAGRDYQSQGVCQVILAHLGHFGYPWTVQEKVCAATNHQQTNKATPKQPTNNTTILYKCIILCNIRG